MIRVRGWVSAPGVVDDRLEPAAQAVAEARLGRYRTAHRSEVS